MSRGRPRILNAKRVKMCPANTCAVHKDFTDSIGCMTRAIGRAGPTGGNTFEREVGCVSRGGEPGLSTSDPHMLGPAKLCHYRCGLAALSSKRSDRHNGHWLVYENMVWSMKLLQSFNYHNGNPFYPTSSTRARVALVNYELSPKGVVGPQSDSKASSIISLKRSDLVSSGQVPP